MSTYFIELLSMRINEAKSPYSLIQNRNNFLFLQINGIFLEMLTVLFYCTEEISMRKFSLVFCEHTNTWAYLGVVTWKHLSVIRYSCGTLLSLLKAFTCKFFFHLQNKFKWSVSLILWMKETETMRSLNHLSKITKLIGGSSKTCLCSFHIAIS